MITRRTLIAGGIPLLASCSNRTVFAPMPSQLNQTIIANTTDAFTSIVAKASLHTLTNNDIDIGVTNLDKLLANMNEVNFDANLSAAMKKMNPTLQSLNLTNNPIVDLTYTRFKQAGAAYTLSDLQGAFAASITPSTFKSQLHELQMRGIHNSGLALQHSLSTLVVRNSTGIKTADFSFCETLNWYSGVLGIAGFSLALGCLPEPFFVVICPAITVIGIVAGAFALLDFLFC